MQSYHVHFKECWLTTPRAQSLSQCQQIFQQRIPFHQDCHHFDYQQRIQYLFQQTLGVIDLTECSPLHLSCHLPRLQQKETLFTPAQCDKLLQSLSWFSQIDSLEYCCDNYLTALERFFSRKQATHGLFGAIDSTLAFTTMDRLDTDFSEGCVFLHWQFNQYPTHLLQFAQYSRTDFKKMIEQSKQLFFLEESAVFDVGRLCFTQPKIDIHTVRRMLGNTGTTACAFAIALALSSPTTSLVVDYPMLCLVEPAGDRL